MFSVHVGSLLDYISCMLASKHPTLSRRYRLEYDQQPEYDRFDRSGGYLSIVPSPERSKLSTMLDMAVVLSTMLDMAVAGLSIVLDTAVRVMIRGMGV